MKIFPQAWLTVVLAMQALAALAQAGGEHRQAYLAIIYHVKPSEAVEYVHSNRQYASALASHNVSEPILRWNAYADDDTYNFLWLHPFEHLNDIETLSSTESQIDERIKKEHWDAGRDLHNSVDHTEEFIIRDEPSLSRLPTDLDGWTRQSCEFRVYYTSGGYGGSDAKVRELWRKYRAAFPPKDTDSRYRILRVLIGLERPLWVVQRCGSSWEAIRQQQDQEGKAAGSEGAQVMDKFRKYVRKVEVWRFRFDPEMSYPRAAARP